MSGTAWAAVVIFAVAYTLIATEKVHPVAAALGGATLMLLIGATDAKHAFFSEDAGIDWNVIFLLLGMMLIVAVLKRTGVFEYIAIWAAKRAKGRPLRARMSSRCHSVGVSRTSSLAPEVAARSVKSTVYCPIRTVAGDTSAGPARRVTARMRASSSSTSKGLVT